jgi:hypothetical protein
VLGRSRGRRGRSSSRVRRGRSSSRIGRSSSSVSSGASSVDSSSSSIACSVSSFVSGFDSGFSSFLSSFSGGSSRLLRASGEGESSGRGGNRDGELKHGTDPSDGSTRLGQMISGRWGLIIRGAKKHKMLNHCVLYSLVVERLKWHSLRTLRDVPTAQQDDRCRPDGAAKPLESI